MSIDKFEEHIKNAFERYRPASDNDAIWENIEPHLKKKKKRRFIIFFWWGLGLGLLMLFWWHSERKPYALPQASSAIQTVATQPGKMIPGHTPAFAATPQSALEQSGNQSTNSGNPKAALFAKTQTPKPDAAPIPVGKNNIETFAGTAEKTARGATNGVITDTRVVDDLPVMALEPALPEATAPVPETAAPANPDLAANDTPAQPEPVVERASDKAEYAENAKPEKPDFAETAHPGITENGTKEDQTTAPDKKGKAEKTDKNTSQDKKKDARKKSKKRRYRWEQNLNIQAGPAMALRQLRERSGLNYPAGGYLAARNSTEKSLESFTAGLFYSVATRRGLVLKAGLDYRQANEKFHLAYNETTTEQIIGVLTVTVNGSGDIVGQTTGPKTVTKTIEYNNTAYNRYRYLNLPLGFGYRETGKKSHWELCAGADINLFFRTGGTIYNRFNEPTPLKFGSSFYDDVFRRSTGLGVWTSFAYGRKLSKKLRWQVSANIQMPVFPVTQTDYELEQWYVNFGVQAGVVYEIRKGKKR